MSSLVTDLWHLCRFCPHGGVLCLAAPDDFSHDQNVRNITEQVAILAMVAMTMTVVMVVGDFDLSVGASGQPLRRRRGRYADPRHGAVAKFRHRAGRWHVGRCAQRSAVAYAGLSAFVATLATMTAYRGLSLWYTDGATFFTGIDEAFRPLGQGTTGHCRIRSGSCWR